MTSRFFWCTTWLLLLHPQFHGQASTQELPSGPEPAQVQTAPGVPEAVVVEQPPPGDLVRMEADHQSKEKNIVRLTGNVVLRYQDYVIHSQELSYDDDTGVVTSTGHVELDGGPDHEHISAASGDMNLKLQTAHFFTAVGTLQRPPPRVTENVPLVTNIFSATPNSAVHETLQSTSPFLFTAKEVVKEGPGKYTLYSAVVTSCELPHPDWAFFTHRTQVDDKTAKMYESLFRVLDVPIFYLPYATHSTDVEGRQSGVLIPIIGLSSTKGLVLGDEYYWAINRSMDLTLGLDYYSIRGYAPLGQFRYKGRDQDFVQFRFTALKDRGQPGTGIDQGGTDMFLNWRHDFDPTWRVVGNLEYLSSYIYRQAFAESFNLAVASQVKSDAFVVKEDHGYAAMVAADRFQNFIDTSGEQLRILHVPSLELDALDHSLGGSGFYWNGRIAADGLERAQPNFSTSGVVERFDFYPHVGYVWHGGGWTFRPEIAARETFYSRSQSERIEGPWLHFQGPTEVDASTHRNDAEASVDVLAPAVEREFGSSDGDADGWGVRHVVQPEMHYRFVGGVHDFSSILRFDATDIVSDTNEVEYGVTQRLFVKHRRTRACKVGEKPPPGSTICHDKEQEAIRWYVAQKYFLDPTFGGAVVPQYRNVLATTLDFSGTAYLTGNRDVSPIVSRLRWASTETIDLETDEDYDTKRGRLLTSNSFLDFHQGNWIAGTGVSRMVQPAEVSLGSIPKGLDFLQVRWQLGYGSLAKRGFSAATSGGYDVNSNAVQFGVAQVGYNWNCCGISGEYRRIALGPARNENQYLFNFTLAGVGTAGNLKRSERLF